MSIDPDVQTQAALTANRLASVAVGFSIAAFLMAYLQLFLGNLMSGQALWKTNQAATGVLARHRAWRPSLRRIKILYPKISLQPVQLLQAARSSTPVQKSPLHHEIFHDRPRATWAQIVQAFNITNPSSLVEAYLDSDTIPSAIDVPIQRVRVFDLAQLALYLGCTKVEVNAEERYLRATGPVCTLKTEVIPTFGNAIRFEGDLAALMQRALGNHDAATALVADRICLGRFLTGVHIRELKAFRTHFNIMCECLDNKWPCKKYYEALRSAWPPRSIELERRMWSFADEIEMLNIIRARLPKVLPANDSLTQVVFPAWQATIGLTTPSAILSATMAVVPGAFIGYPSKLFLDDLMPWCMMEAQLTLELDKSLDHATVENRVISLSERVQDLALELDFSFCDRREHMPFLCQKPAYSWLASSLSNEYNSLEKSIRDSISSSRPQHPRTAYNVKSLILPWTFELLKDYRPFEWAQRFQRRCRDTHKSQFHPCKLLSTQLIILDIGIRLQIKGSPHKLDGRVEEGIELQEMDMEQEFNRSLILEAPSIVAAIMDSHLLGSIPPQPTDPGIDIATDVKLKDTTDDTYQKLKYRPWDLHSALLKHCTFYDDMDVDEASMEYKRLAIMLRLRALIFIAFLMIGPDTSLVYNARGSPAQVHII
ncbi:Nn.00g069030.m01.CDS01 [Neocucurbitaria sp. VM-36]